MFSLKKIVLTLCFVLLCSCAVSANEKIENEPLKAEVTFDWISKTQIQRDTTINEIQNILFNEKTVLKYPKKQFKNTYFDFYKDKDYLTHYANIKKGLREDSDKYFAGFYIKNLFIAYGIQYKNNMKNIFYYDALGQLRFVDIFSQNYPKYPYYALQYNDKGKLIGTVYFVSDFDQYIFNPDKTFKGRWYKEKMYNAKAKVIMTRSNW